MCTSSEAYKTHFPAKPCSFAGALASRAITRPIKFARDPPPVRLPRKPAHPIASARPTNDRPLQRDCCGGRAPSSNVLVKYAGQQVGDCAYRLSGTKHIAKEATVLRPAVVNHIMEICESFCPHCIFWQGGLK